jgi:hypothetical protein
MYVDLRIFFSVLSEKKYKKKDFLDLNNPIRNKKWKSAKNKRKTQKKK